jgi:predicted dehydrogenase
MAVRTRWGILATGGIATSFADDLKLLPGAELAAVGSRSIESARRFAAAHGIARAHGSWAELAADPEVDAVYVATPHTAHHEASKMCLRAGKVVLCEKPVALDLAEAQDLVATAKEYGQFFMEAMWMRALPGIRRIADLVADGAIGELTAVHADFAIAGPFAPSHRLRDPAVGGGALLDLGVYPVSFAHLFLGPPDRITALATLTPEGVDENTGIIFGYGTGALATLHCAITGPGGNTATITGTAGRIEVPGTFFRPERFTLVRGGRREEIETPIRGIGLGYEAEEVRRCLAAGLLESPLMPWSASLDVMRSLDDIRTQIGVRYPSPLRPG